MKGLKEFCILMWAMIKRFTMMKVLLVVFFIYIAQMIACRFFRLNPKFLLMGVGLSIFMMAISVLRRKKEKDEAKLPRSAELYYWLAAISMTATEVLIAFFGRNGAGASLLFLVPILVFGLVLTRKTYLEGAR